MDSHTGYASQAFPRHTRVPSDSGAQSGNLTLMGRVKAVTDEVAERTDQVATSFLGTRSDLEVCLAPAL